MHPPPLTSKYNTGLTEHELKLQRQAVRREKARVRMAMRRAELKSRPLEEQEEAAKHARLHQATYRANATVARLHRLHHDVSDAMVAITSFFRPTFTLAFALALWSPHFMFPVPGPSALPPLAHLGSPPGRHVLFSPAERVLIMMRLHHQDVIVTTFHMPCSLAHRSFGGV
ncbi:hypothetical protein B0H13DRAFT_2336144 [Mycena leptocephala]|nr:hypothetical protein B0H13DRAFT_2336144 [Mycena leptocephala]